MPALASLNNHFLANKFLIDYDPITYQCMEELYLDRVKNQRQFLNLQDYCDTIKMRSDITKCI